MTRNSACALALVASLAAGRCITSPSPVVTLGPWGGPHVSMDVTSGGARLEYDCAEGVIEPDPPTVRLPPSRAKRASASLAEAFGGGGKADTTALRKAL